MLRFSARSHCVSCFIITGLVLCPSSILPAQSDPRLPFPQNRVHNFYARQAEQALNEPATTAGAVFLPQFPGLDGGGFGHWGQNPEEVSFDHSLNEVDTGNVVCQLTHHSGKTTAKGVNVLVDPETRTTVLYDPERMTFVDAWRNGFVKWGFVRFGLMGGVEAAGASLADFSGSGWHTSDANQPQYRGFYRHGRSVAFETRIGSARVLDSCTVVDGQLVRSLQTEGTVPRGTFLVLLKVGDVQQIEESGTGPDHVIRVKSDTGTVQISLMGSGPSHSLKASGTEIGLQLDEMDGHTAHLQILVESEDNGNTGKPLLSADRVAVPSIREFEAGGEGQWTSRTAEVRGTFGKDHDGMAIDTITLPSGPLNPFRSALRIGGVGCLPNGDVVVSTLMGEIWRVSGTGTLESAPLRWQRIAAGFYQALGIVIQGDSILVLGSDQITRLHDRNGDQEIDFYECVTNRYPTTGGHDFCTSLQQDDAKNLYWSVSSRDFGVARMTPDGSVESLGYGLRNSNGIGVSRDGKVVLATVQEGTWTPASAIFEVGGHSYHGVKGPKEGHGKYGYDLPLCFIPRGVDNSSGEIGFLPKDERLGSLSGAAIGTSFGACQVYLVLRDVVNGKSQGTIVPLPGDFLSGVCRVAFSTADGGIYVAGTEGWQSYAREDGCLQRIRLTEKSFPVPEAVEAYGNGLIVRFSEPLARDSVDLKHVFCQQWNYLYSAGYGSPEYSVREPGRQGHDRVIVKSVRLLKDERSVFLEIPELHPVMQFHAHLNLKTKSGTSFSRDLFSSLFDQRPDFQDFEGYAPVARRRAPDFPIAEKYEQDPRLVKQEQFGTNFGWVSSSAKLTVSAAPGLQYEPRTLRVAPGTRVSLAFRNGDPGMPHNLAVVKADAVDHFGEQSMQLASNPRAIATHYVPADPAEICFSPILQPGDQYTLYFEAPQEPGEYRMVCTYPGHWRVMQGSLFVIPEGEPLPASAAAPIRKFVQMWTLADFPEADSPGKRNFEQGRRTAELAGCLKCHKIGESGTPLGPELTKISERFRGQKLLQQVLEPSVEVNRQFQTWVAALHDGRVIAGLMVEQTPEEVTLLPNPLKPETRISVPRTEIEELEASLISTMPTSLLITFTKDEILDLLAFVQAGGNPGDAGFSNK